MKNKMMLMLCLVSGYVQCAEGYQEGGQEVPNLIDVYLLPNVGQIYTFNTLPVQFFEVDGTRIGLKYNIGIQYADDIKIVSDLYVTTLLQNPENENIRQKFVDLAIQNCPKGYEDRLIEKLRDEGLIPTQLGKMNWWSDD